MFFSAIALVAFSSLSLANTIAVEEEVKADSKEVVLQNQPCMDEAILRVNRYEDTYGCLSATQYTWYLNSYYNSCMNKCQITAD